MRVTTVGFDPRPPTIYARDPRMVGQIRKVLPLRGRGLEDRTRGLLIQS